MEIADACLWFVHENSASVIMHHTIHDTVSRIYQHLADVNLKNMDCHYPNLAKNNVYWKQFENCKRLQFQNNYNLKR